MSGVELAAAYISLTVSARGISDDIANELNLPITKAAKQAGTDASKSLAGGVKSGSSAIESEARSIGSKFTSIGNAAKTAGSEIGSGFQGAGTSILGAAAAPAALATAVVGAAAVAGKAISAYQDLGLSVGKLSDATGLSAEQSSRWIEVANDAGVSTENLSKTVGFLEKAAGKTPEVFDTLGVSIAHAADGTVDANQTFLNAIDTVNAIKDPNEKAAAAVQLFGRSWSDMSELIGRGSGQLKQDLASVQASKVFGAEDVKQARGLRDAFDAIHDAADGLLLTLGKALAPVVADLAPKLADLVTKAEPAIRALGTSLANAAESAGPFLDMIGKLASFGEINIDGEKVSLFTAGLASLAEQAGISGEQLAKFAIGPVSELIDSSVELTGSAEGMKLAITDTTLSTQQFANAAIHADDVMSGMIDTGQTAAQRQRDLAAASNAVTKALDAASAAFARLTGKIDADQAIIDLANDFDNVRDSGAEAFAAAATGADDAAKKVRANQTDVNTLKLAVIDYGDKILGLPPERVTKMLADIDQGSMDRVQQQLEILARNRTVTLQIQQKGGAGYDGGRDGKPSATGGPAYAGRPYLVGDGQNGQIGKWTELFVPNVDGTIISAPQLRSMMAMDTTGTSGSGAGAGIVMNGVEFHSDVDVDGFFRAAEFHLGAAT